MTNDTYTLAEADRELRRRQCQRNGHDWSFDPRRMVDEAPPGICCDRCGWRGTITMGEKP